MPVSPKQAVDDPSAGAVNPVVLLSFARCLEQVRAHAGSGGEGKRQGNDDGAGKRNRELAEEPSYDAAHHEDRNKYGDERGAHGENREADLLRTFEGGGKGRYSVFKMAGDVLHYHNGVVYHEAGGDGERHEGQVVQAVAQQIHNRDGADEGGRNRHGGNKRGARASQEKENNQDDEHNRYRQILLHIIHGSSNSDGAVVHDGGRDALGKDRLQQRQLRADAVYRLDDVGVWLPEDMDRHGALTVYGARCADIGSRVHHVGHIGKANGLSIVIADNQRLVLIGARDLVVGKNIFR